MIETPQLVLRPLRQDDLQGIHDAVLSDPSVTWDGRARTVEETQRALDAKIKHFDTYGFGMMAVIDQTDEALIGNAGLQHLEDGPEVELGYYLGRDAWGRGFATELACAVVDHAFSHLRPTRVVAVVRPENAASKRVLAKAGLQPIGRAHHYDADVEMWAIEAP